MSLRQEVTAIKDSAKAAITLDKSSGAASISEEHFESTLPEGLTLESYKAHNGHRDNYIAGVHLALGELGVEASKENSELSQVSLATKVINDSLTCKVTRSRTGHNPQKPGETVTTFGASSNAYTVSGAQNKGQLKKVRTQISDSYRALANG